MCLLLRCTAPCVLLNPVSSRSSFPWKWSLVHRFDLTLAGSCGDRPVVFAQADVAVASRARAQKHSLDTFHVHWSHIIHVALKGKDQTPSHCMREY